MQKLVEKIGRSHPASNVLIVCSSEERSLELMDLLSERGLNPVGFADRASVALALAAQMPADVAIVQSELRGRRRGEELARILEAEWGTRAVLVEQL